MRIDFSKLRVEEGNIRFRVNLRTKCTILGKLTKRMHAPPLRTVDFVSFAISETLTIFFCCIFKVLHTITIMNRQTPTVRIAIDPFLMMPALPKRDQIIDGSKRKRMLGDLDRLGAPSLTSPVTAGPKRRILIDGSRTSKFESGLERMRRGDALKRLRKLQLESQAVSQQSQTVPKTEESTNSGNIPNLSGRRLPKRNSSFSHAA